MNVRMSYFSYLLDGGDDNRGDFGEDKEVCS
jgi:hypothetical protein